MKVEVFVEFEPNQKKTSEVECRGRKKLENSAILSEVRGQNSSEVEVNPHSSDLCSRKWVDSATRLAVETLAAAKITDATWILDSFAASYSCYG